MRSKAGRAILSLLLFLEIGCATLPSLADRQAAADRVAGENGFEKTFIRTQDFSLIAYSRLTGPGKPLNLYIEGDGSAWISRTVISDDPTPKEPMVLELAARDPAPNIVYLARPGQYTGSVGIRCDPAFWSDRRFAGEVVEALNSAIDQLTPKIGATRINLVGYSGGAALAVLIAAQRDDVASLRTVAGNLDPEALNRYHGVSPLDKASPSPMNVAAKLKGVPQRHFVGSQDAVVPSFIARSFLERAGSRDFREMTVVDGASHAKGWRERWRTLLAIPPQAPK